MSYASNFLKAYGTPCTIQRTPTVNSKVSMKVATKSIYDNHRDSLREGVILADSLLQGGEIVEVLGDKFMVRAVSPDYATDQIYLFASKINAELKQSRLTETTDLYGNVTTAWTIVTATVYSSAHVVSAELRQQEPGLLETTTIVLLVSNTLTVKKLDRFQFLPSGQKLQVDSIDDIKLPGIIRIQCSEDLRQ